MDAIKYSILKPVTVIVGVILVVLFGLIGLYGMPYQLSPTVTEPEIAVMTFWPGATPYEVERDIIEEQEKVLKGITGLITMESTSFNNQGSITLRFKIGTDVDNALLRVSNKLNEVPRYPVNVEKPIIIATGVETSPVIWTILKAKPDNPASVYTYKTFFENEVRQQIERVEGVSDLLVAGGREKEMHIVIKPEKLAAYNLTVNELIRLLVSSDINVSAGTMGVGRREFRIRTLGELKTPGQINNLILQSTGQKRIYLKDVATAEFGYEKATVAMFQDGDEGIAVGIKPAPGANVLELTDRVERVVEDLNSGTLAENGVYLKWAYDQRPYIRGAIDLVRQNILIGGVLAVVVLFVFLRNVSSTIVVSVAIPISILGTFIFMRLLGRNLNVVSLAGISFAVGMLVDNSIVVLENIDRHRTMGKTPFRAAYDGTREVWGAVLASTVTTVAVFLPIIFMKEEAGQLFKDIAIAITFSVTLSLFVSVFVIPMLSKQLFSFFKGKEGKKESALTRLSGVLIDLYMALVGWVIRDWKTRVVTILGLTFFAVASVYLLLPKMEYLPQGNRNLLINILVPPPGLSYKEKRDMWLKNIFPVIKPHFNRDYKGFPGIKQTFYIASDQFNLFGAISDDQRRAHELIPLFRKAIFSIPGMFGISTQAGIFESRLGRGRTIDIDISGDDINRIVMATGAMYGLLKQAIPDAQLRPIPSLEILYPEARIIPDRDRLKAVGMSAGELGILVDVLMDGRKIGDFKGEGKKKIDLVLKTSEEDISTPEELYRAQTATPTGRVVPVSSLSRLVRTTGISEIRHLERKRTITLQVTPPLDMPLETVMEGIKRKYIPALKKQGILNGIDVRLAGAADKLTEARQAIQWNFILAAIIIYLLMAALFENFIYPLIVMFTIPLAGAGGFIGLKFVNIFIARSPFDILTMLGFVILIGVVVNNAILIVHQSQNFIRYQNLAPRQAVLDATRSRLRPIYMSAFTSIFGMLPLVVAPGPGSELYRGLGSVVLGGIALSTIFTTFIIPALLMFVINKERPAGKKSDEEIDTA
ncbi:MAG: efflux RND transporter permease subunit [Thermodesulfobacteriota bacterium]|nr:MAG: efflux RND transporter permease subunit [Thermodesulfobacteriota bacterium]